MSVRGNIFSEAARPNKPFWKCRQHSPPKLLRYSCRAGLTVASILNNGGISGCLSIRSDYQQGNIYQDNFWDVWNNRFKNYRNREWMRNEQCEECEVFKYCQGSGMHLRDSQGKLMLCHYNKLKY